MRKILGLGLLAFLSLSFFFSCKDSETYAEKLKRERKAISRLISDSGYVVIKEYPANGVFKENEFYYDDETRVYYNVVDSGNGLRATKGREIYVRYRGAISVVQEGYTPESNMGPSEAQDYLNFTYGQTATYTDYSYTTTYSNYAYKSSGLILPLDHIGDSAIIRIIVPFNMGSGLQQAAYEPVYFDWMQYSFRKRQGE